ncbi:MAG: aldehyde dehydrogenase family protein [Candidatus Aegiribacteria sp.]|nr:aldehyde dehydrogenase family protein [Candidatus Aegiribacteria sp.]MBD3295308.1 aldehyde dehydrogenase family protein [Candidatus Fermentibacteria bacterium]
MLPGKARGFHEPFGVAVIIGPWNYPAGLLLCPMVSALAAGNTVILKPSERSPHTSDLLRVLIGEYFPKDLVSVVMGGGDIAAELIREAADIVCFTGSRNTGRKVMTEAAKRPVPVVLELGGANPCFVDENADIKSAARRIAWGRFFGAGQTCLAPNHVFVHKTVEDELLSELEDTVTEFYGENPMESEDYGRIIDSLAWSRIRKLAETGTPITGGTWSEEDLYIAPTVLTDVDPESALVKEEIFGPLLPVIPCDSIADRMESIPAGDSSPLAAYGFSRKGRRMQSMLREKVRAASITVNGTLHRIVSSSIGFGGVGGSGFGRYRGVQGFRNFSWQRVIVRKHPSWEMPLLYPPYRIGRKLVKLMSRFF